MHVAHYRVLGLHKWCTGGGQGVTILAKRVQEGGGGRLTRRAPQNTRAACIVPQGPKASKHTGRASGAQTEGQVRTLSCTCTLLPSESHLASFATHATQAS